MRIELVKTPHTLKQCTCTINLEKREQYYTCIDCDTTHHVCCQVSTYSQERDPIRALIKDYTNSIEKLCEGCSYRRKNNIPKIDKQALRRARLAHMKRFLAREEELIKAHIAAEEQRYNNKHYFT